MRTFNPALLTTTEAAAVLRVSRPTIHRAIQNHELDVVRIGKTVRVKRESVLRLLGKQVQS